MKNIEVLKENFLLVVIMKISCMYIECIYSTPKHFTRILLMYTGLLPKNIDGVVFVPLR